MATPSISITVRDLTIAGHPMTAVYRRQCVSMSRCLTSLPSERRGFGRRRRGGSLANRLGIVWAAKVEEKQTISHQRNGRIGRPAIEQHTEH
jgi:hypothetical protein